MRLDLHPHADPAASRGVVLSLCDRSGVMVEPWLEAGYECWIVDLQHPEGERITPKGGGRLVTVGADVCRWLPPLVHYAICFAFPPCTQLAVSGARWFKEKGLQGLADGFRLVERCAEIAAWAEAPWMLENPVSTLSTYWRRPDNTFDPCDFGGYAGGEADGYTKKTCLWTGEGFVMPEARRIPPVNGSRMHLLPPSADRSDLRSLTPRGFAQAVFEANGNIAATARTI